jgi:hypothetical protein
MKYPRLRVRAEDVHKEKDIDIRGAEHPPTEYECMTAGPASSSTRTTRAPSNSVGKVVLLPIQLTASERHSTAFLSELLLPEIEL